MVLIPIGVGLVVVAFVVVLLHLPSITGAAIPIFIGVALVLGCALGGLTGYRSRTRVTSTPSLTSPPMRRRVEVVLLAIASVGLAVWLVLNWNTGVLANLGGIAVAVAILFGLLLLIGIAFMNGELL
jgi:hypothetical protein